MTQRPTTMFIVSHTHELHMDRPHISKMAFSWPFVSSVLLFDQFQKLIFTDTKEDKIVSSVRFIWTCIFNKTKLPSKLHLEKARFFYQSFTRAKILDKEEGFGRLSFCGGLRPSNLTNYLMVKWEKQGYFIS